MRRLAIFGCAAICLTFVFIGSSADGAVLVDLYNTGVDNAHAVLPDGTVGDPHYTLTSVPGGTTTTLIRTASGGFPIPPYLGDNSTSRWIGPNNSHDLSSPPGNYVFQTTFDLTGYNPLSASISGGWSSDNDGVGIYLNGNLVSGPTDFTQFLVGFAPFTITSGFLPGVNTLEFVVHNGGSGVGNNDGGNNPTALRTEMNGIATAVPEASSFLVIGLGGVFALGAISLGKRCGITIGT